MDERVIISRIEDLTKGDAGWNISITCSEGFWDMTAFRGDCNCSHAKEYDPKDGHGYSSVDEDDQEPFARTLEEALKRFEERAGKIIPGRKT